MAALLARGGTQGEATNTQKVYCTLQNVKLSLHCNGLREADQRESIAARPIRVLSLPQVVHQTQQPTTLILGVRDAAHPPNP